MIFRVDCLEKHSFRRNGSDFVGLLFSSAVLKEKSNEKEKKEKKKKKKKKKKKNKEKEEEKK